MTEDRQITVRYNNGNELKLSFPVQIRNSSAAVLEGMKRIMESDKLVFEAEGRLILIPWASVQQLEVSPAPPALPFGAIQHAKVVNE